MTFRTARPARHLALGAAALSTLLAAAPGAHAVEFEYGDVSGSVINTVSAGMQIRAEQRDRRFVSPANGGLPIPGLSTNSDDGNLNFDQGDIVSAPLRLTTEFDAKWRKFGVYARGSAFYDTVLDRNDLAVNGPASRPYRGKLNPQAYDAASKGAEVLDLYARGEFDVAGNPFNIRVGQQTVTWGEALVTQNGINIINPLDATKLNTPGAELRDGLTPVPMVWASYRVAEGLSFEGFYQWQFRPLKNNIPGTFFSTSDAGSPETVGLGGVASSAGDCRAAGFCFRETAPRDDDDEGNFGFAARYFSQELNNTEFGLYYAHYTSRFPSLNYRADNSSTNPVPALQALANISRSEAYLVYPKDVQMIGASFNTSWDEEGVAINGELSYKKDVPANIQGVTVVRDAINRAGGAPTAAGGVNALYNQLDPGCGSGVATCKNFGRGGESVGFVRVDAYNMTLRATKSLFTTNPIVSTLGADSASTFVEAAVIYVPDLPESGNLMISPYPTNSFTPGVPVGNPLQGLNRFIDRAATKVSSGATWSFSAQYLSAFGTSVNLTPSVTYQQGIQGATPIAGGFLSGFKAANFALRADYLINLSATINYAARWGGGFRNLNADRDFVGLTVSYQF
jgi:hypothetical protein